MHPILLSIAGFHVRSYTVFVSLALVAAYLLRRAETTRLGYAKDPRHRYVGLGALIGAALGCKLGMILFVPWHEFLVTVRQAFSLDFSGKTVVGGLAGGYLGVELTKKLVGVRYSTGDGFAIAFLVGQSIGRIGCLLNGCCFGEVTQVPWAVTIDGVPRHPAPLYEAAALLAVAGALFVTRDRPLRQGYRFRVAVVAYALVRICVEPFRGDPVNHLFGVNAVQVFCGVGILALAIATAVELRAQTPSKAAA
ncbi:MAG: prolipoprotein diacylglyceryl transferase [Myxococcaceae bacterium]